MKGGGNLSNRSFDCKNCDKNTFTYMAHWGSNPEFSHRTPETGPLRFSLSKGHCRKNVLWRGDTLKNPMG